MGIIMPIMGSRKDRKSRIARRHGIPSGLAGALFTSTQRRVLALLFGQPGRSFYANELIELTGSGSGAVQRELKRLSSSGLVTVRRIGNQKHYQANPDSPIFDELHGLVVKTVALVDPLKAALEPLADRIDLAMLFGSMAKGTDTAKSDVDLLIVAEGLILEEVYKILLPLEETLDRKISPTLYTPREFEKKKSANNAFIKRLLAGEKVILIGSPDDN